MSEEITTLLQLLSLGYFIIIIFVLCNKEEDRNTPLRTRDVWASVCWGPWVFYRAVRITLCMVVTIIHNTIAYGLLAFGSCYMHCDRYHRIEDWCNRVAGFNL